MNLYLLRHGIAEDHSEQGGDAARALTEEGRGKLANVLHRAAEGGVRPDRILSSPYVRALETAQLAAKLLNGPEPLETTALVPHGNPRNVWYEICANRDAAQLLLAGHEPLFSQLAGYLLDAPTLKIEMKKGALVAIEMESFRGEPHGVLKWMLIPKVS
jgi:phosphohistidine phosphatase